MLGKIKTFFGLDEVSIIEPAQADSSLIELKALQAENRELRKIIKQKNAQLQELSQENMALGRDRQVMANTIAEQHRRIEIYKRQLV
ncbi:hypothetical protein [Streptococcus suis]|uniref:hypothetical protein n=1 Tax=Streptococcus suis TaxID=1307 RepID=UPI000C198B5F|nr:hypothetical protein [Streptococcus suis]